MNILDAIADPQLFGHFLGPDHSSWQNWLAALRAVYGLRVPKRFGPLVKECTGRERRHLPRSGFNEALFLTGRRCGKSRAAALIGAFEGLFAGHARKLAKGEQGLVVVTAPTKAQAGIVRGYIRAVFDTPLLAREVVSESGGAFELRNGLQVDVLAGDWRSIRGFTLVAAIVDEVAFFGLEEECRVRSDTELIRAIRPALATTGGKLLGITTPYARKGYCWQTYKRHFGVDKAPVLVWNCPSRMMNPTLPQSVVDAAMAEDRQAALSEYMGQFRDDVAEFLPRSLIEGLVVPGRRELLPRVATRYSAFVDVSGGRHDEAALAVGHKQGRRVVVDMLRRYRPPFNPHDVVRQMVDALRPYHVRGVVGDNYAAEWVAGAFRAYGTGYTKCPKAKSPLYLELLPRLCSGEIELLDDEQAVDQLSNLERRTRSGGKDVVDHPPGGHDDLANAIAGLADTVAGPGGRVIGGFTSLARARHERILTGGTI